MMTHLLVCHVISLQLSSVNLDSYFRFSLETKMSLVLSVRHILVIFIFHRFS